MILNKGATPEKAFMLSKASAGTYIVENISGPDQQRLRLHELGITAGTPVSVLSCAREGMQVVKIGSSRLALSSGSAENIWVRHHML